MEKSFSIRVDKYIWCVRFFKTRSIAAEECSKHHVYINNFAVKASAIVRVGDEIIVKRTTVNYKYKVLQLLSNRVGAKFVAEYIKDITSEDELKKLENLSSSINLYRDKGTGRPTKKDRREIDKLFYDSM